MWRARRPSRDAPDQLGRAGSPRPEDALPDKWEAFVGINYAFPDADKIKALTDEYATEHNVRNAPLEAR